MQGILRLILLVLMNGTLMGCGYNFQGGGTILPPDVHAVYVPLVQNESSEPGLATQLTEALQDRFSRFGVLNVVDTRDMADAVLTVNIEAVRRKSSTVNEETTAALQFDTELLVSGELRRITGPLLWRSEGMLISKQFAGTQGTVVTTSSDFAQSGLNAEDIAALSSREITRGQQSEALSDLIEIAAARIYDESVAPDF